MNNDIKPPRSPQASIVTSLATHDHKNRRMLKILTSLLVLVVVTSAVYMWQQSKVTDLTASQTSLQSKVTDLQSQLAAKDATPAVVAITPAETETTTVTPAPVIDTYNVVTGAVLSKEVGSALLDELYLPGKVTALWIEYGTVPGTLNLSTTHVTQGLGEGGSTYASQPFKLTGLTTGNYFYRAAATVDGKTVYGGMASFASAK